MSDIPGQWRIRYYSLLLMGWKVRYFSTSEEAEEFWRSRSDDPWGIGVKQLVDPPEFVTAFDLIRETGNE